MPENVSYKNFTEEEDRVYRKSIEMIRSGLGNGLKFSSACELIAVEDMELKNLIIDNALKVEIAELHYGKGQPLIDVSKKLGVSMERLLKANAEMIEDVLNTAAEGGSEPLTH